MYSNEAKLDALIAQAEREVLANDRAKFAPVLGLVERFCAENRTKCVIWSAPAVSSPSKFTRDNMDAYFMIVLMSDHVFETTNEILAKVKFDTSIDQKLRSYATMLTIAKHIEIELKVLGRTVALFHRAGVAFGRQPQIDYIACMKPAVVRGPFTALDVSVAPAELLLIDVYRQMYSPLKFDDMPQLRQVESALIAAVKTRFVGAGRREKHRAPFNARIIRDAMSASGKSASLAADILIGRCAVDILAGKPVTENTRLQVLTADFTSFAAKFARVAGIEVSLADRSAFVWDDFLMRRAELSVATSEKKKAVCDAYNAPEYSLVPYVVKDGVKLGAPAVILRFLFADAWHLRIIAECTQSDGIKARADALIKTALEYRATLGDLTMQETNYAGVSVNEKAEKKAVLREAGEFGMNRY